jgi:MFS family permease
MSLTVASHASIDAVKVEKQELEHVDVEEHTTSSSAIDDLAIDEEFVWSYDVITNLIALNAVYFAASWALVVPTSAIGFIARVFPENASDSPWIAAAVTIPNCILQAFLGDLSDILDRRWFLLVGTLFGLCGNLVAGRATGMDMVLAGQVLNGIGVTLDYLAIPLSAETVPKKDRPVISAISMIVAGVATVFGPLAQGGFIKHEIGGTGNGWRGGFYFGAGFFAVAFGLVFWLYHPQQRPNPENLSKVHRILKIDWFGVFFVTAGLCLFLVGLHYGNNPYPWDSAKVLATMIVGVLCILIFIAWEWKGTPVGLLRHDMFEHRNYAVTLLATFTSGMVFFGGQAYIPQEVLYIFTDDPVMTSVWTYPYNVACIIGATCSGIYMAWSKEAKGLMIGSFAGLALGSGLMVVIHPGINFAGWFFPTAIMGFAVGAQVATSIVVVGLCTPDRFIGLAISMAGAIRGLGGSIGVTIFSTIFSSKLDRFLPQKIGEVLIEAGMSKTTTSEIIPEILDAVSAGTTDALVEIPGITSNVVNAIKVAVAEAYSDSFPFIWYSLLPFAVVSMLVSTFLKSTKQQMTGVVAAGVQRRH